MPTVPTPQTDALNEGFVMSQNNELYLPSTVSVVFSDCRLDLALRQICADAHLSVSCPSDHRETLISGNFYNQPVDAVLESVALSAGLKVRWVSDSFASLYTSDADERIYTVVNCPFLDSESIPSTDNLNVTFAHGQLIICGDRIKTKQFLSAIVELNNNCTVSFGCDLCIVRLSQRAFLNAGVDVNFNTVNLLKLASVSDLINLFVRLDGNFNRSKQIINSFVYLAEGQKTSLEVGSVRQRELKHISSEGYVSTSGYQQFKDGLQIDLTCNSLSEGLFALSSTVENSKFRDSSDGSDVVPINDTSKFTTNKAIVQDGYYALLAVCNESVRSDGLNILGMSSQDGQTVLLIFARVQRFNPSAFGRRVVDLIDIDNL